MNPFINLFILHPSIPHPPPPRTGVQRYYSLLNAQALSPSTGRMPLQYVYIPLIMASAYAHFATMGYMFVHHPYVG